MDCFACKKESKLAVNTPSCRVCVECYYKHDPCNSDEIKNDVLYHISHNSMRTTYTNNAKYCETKYGELAVSAARDYLLSKVKAKFDNIDDDLIKQLATERRTSSGPNGRTKAAAMINDIHTVLQALETKIQVIPANVDNVMSINPEFLLPESVVSRIEELERKLEIQTKEMESLNGKLQMLSTQRPQGEPAADDLETDRVDDDAPTSTADEAATGIAAAKATDEMGLIVDNGEPVVKNANDPAVQSGAVSVSGAAAPAVAGNPATSSASSAATRKATGALKHQRNLNAQNIAAVAAAQAARSGLSMDESAKVGTAAATQLAKSYAESIKLNRSGKKAVTGTIASGQHQIPLTSVTLPKPPHAAQGQTEGWNLVGNPKRKKRLAHTVPYLKGTASAIEGFSLARPKPQYTQNEALVVSGMPTDINGTKMKAYINSRAKRDVELQKVVRLDREYSGWAAVVIELTKDDYSELSKPDFWEEDVYIRPWTGPRFWRGEKRKFLTPQERKNSVRRTWED